MANIVGMFAALPYFGGKKAMVQRGRKVYVLFRNGELAGVWSNLLYLCNEMKEETPFPSYSTVSKMDKAGGRLEFSKGGTQYLIAVETMR